VGLLGLFADCHRSYHHSRCNTLIYPLRGLFQVPSRDNVISFKYISGLVAGNHHRDPFRDSGPDQGSDCSSTEVVNESFSGNPCCFASPLPGLVKGEDSFPLVVEDERACWKAFKVVFPLLLKNDLQDYRQGDHSAVFVLCGPSIEPHRSRFEVYPVPSEGENLTMETPPRVVGPGDRGAKVFRQTSEQGVKRSRPKIPGIFLLGKIQVNEKTELS